MLLIAADDAGDRHAWRVDAPGPAMPEGYHLSIVAERPTFISRMLG